MRADDANTNFEATMRAFQERRFATTGTLLTWPVAGDGASAGSYPPDGFYASHTGSSSVDTKFTAAVSTMMSNISSMCSAFWAAPDAYEGLWSYQTSDMTPYMLFARVGGASYFTSLGSKTAQEKFGVIRILLSRMKYVSESPSESRAGMYGHAVTSTLASAFSASVPVANSAYNGIYTTYAAFYQPNATHWDGEQRGFDLKASFSTGHKKGTMFVGARGYVAGFSTGPNSGAYRFRGVPCDGAIQFRALTSPPTGTSNWQGELINTRYITGKSFTHKLGGGLDDVDDSEPAAAAAAPALASCHCGSCAPGGGKAHEASAHYSWSMGTSLFGGRSNELTLDWENANPAWYSPDSLGCGVFPGFAAIRDSSKHLLQAYGPYVVADVVVVDASHYQLKFFVRNPSWTIGTDGRVNTSGSPYLIYDVGNPDTTGATQNRLRITQSAGTAAEKWTEFSYNSTTNVWTMTRNDNPVIETFSKTDPDSSSQYVTTRIQTMPDTTLVSKVVTTYQKFAWGDEKLSEVLDPSGAALTTTWTYYSNASTDGTNYNKLKKVVYPSGYWESYTYDSLKRLKKTVACYLDAATTAAESDCAVTEITYPSDVSPAVDYTTYVKKVKGTEVSRSYKRDYWDGNDLIVCQTPGAAVGATDNLVTQTRYYLNDDPSGTGALAGRLKSIKRPNGTVALYTYAVDTWTTGSQWSATTGLEAVNFLTTTVKDGKPNSGGTDITDGTITITIANTTGNVISTTVQDKASSVVITQDNVASVNGADGFGRPILINHLNGTSTARSYDCCHLASETDGTGITTSYEQNQDGTVISSARLGITTKSSISGKVTTSTRKGTDATVMTLSTITLDVAGRTSVIADGAGRQSTTAYSKDGSGHDVSTTTRPDGGVITLTRYFDGKLKSMVGTATRPVRYEYGVDGNGQFTKRFVLDASNADTSEWTKTSTDAVGRSFRLETAASAVTLNTYNTTTGLLTKTSDADGVTWLYDYDALGRQNVTAVDMNGDGVINYGGTDRITRVIYGYGSHGGTDVAQASTQVWDSTGANTPQTVRLSETAVTGLQSWSTAYGQTSATSLSLSGSGNWTQTTTNPDGSQLVSTVTGGRVASQVLSHGSATGYSRSYDYDPHGRPLHQVDARDGTTTYAYASDDQVLSVTEPAPSSGDSAYVTSYGYNSAGRVSTITLPDGGVVTRTYWYTGDLKQISGARTYTQNYTYDTAGRPLTLTTATGAVTTWHYGATTGFLTSKEYNDHSGPAYAYTTAGRVHTRTWARGTVTTYGYDAGGTLNAVSYSDSTPAVAYAYNRLGQMITATRSGVTRTIGTRLDGQTGSESWSGGPLSGWSVTPGYDSLNRRSGLTVGVAGQTLTQGVTYDGLSRVDTVSNGADGASYSYESSSSLIQQIAFKHSATTAFTESRVHDLRDRLTSIAASGATGLPSNAPTYDRADQKTRVDVAGGDYWTYGYDTLGQVTAAAKHLSGGAPYGGQQAAYAYDSMGNRVSHDFGGDASGANLRHVTYAQKSNGLNQYDTITWPGYVWTTGQAATGATVAVNGNSTNRQGQYFWKEDSVDNSSGAKWLTEAVSATNTTGTDAFSVHQWLPAISNAPAYDADGNQLGDGRFVFTWDGENRLASAQSAPGSPSGSPVFIANYQYDDAGRRVRKVVTVTTAAGDKVAVDRRFLYDGWNLVAEVDGDGVLARSYTWGVDLSGSWQGAGGVGGLLLARQHRGSSTGVSAVFYDHNGNVSALADMVSHSLTASYDYDAFGKVLRATGPVALSHSIRFSTKYEDVETGFNYYGYRYYHPDFGRWLNVDPQGEAGGVNLYGFVGNAGSGGVDVLGLTLRDEFVTATSNAPYGTAWMISGLYGVWDGVTFGTLTRRESLEHALVQGQITQQQYNSGQVVNGIHGAVDAGLMLVPGSAGATKAIVSISQRVVQGIGTGAALGFVSGVNEVVADRVTAAVTDQQYYDGPLGVQSLANDATTLASSTLLGAAFGGLFGWAHGIDAIPSSVMEAPKSCPRGRNNPLTKEEVEGLKNAFESGFDNKLKNNPVANELLKIFEARGYSTPQAVEMVRKASPQGWRLLGTDLQALLDSLK